MDYFFIEELDENAIIATSESGVTKTKWSGSLNRFVLTIENLKLRREEKKSRFVGTRRPLY